MSAQVHDSIPQDLSPAGALKILKEGNDRFIKNLKINRNLLKQMNDTKDGQWPFAAILSCMDSRTSAELIFDQGLGDIFSIRIAGNIITQGILGSLEYATALAGSRLILVLGHTKCGAIKGACDDVKYGNLTSLLDRIRPSVEQAGATGNHTSGEQDFLDKVALTNVHNSVRQIMEESEVIRELVEKGKVGLVPAMYDVATGKVTFFEQDGHITMANEHQTATSIVA